MLELHVWFLFQVVLIVSCSRPKGVVGCNFFIWDVFSNVCIIKFGIVARIPYILVHVTVDVFIRMKPKFVRKQSMQSKKNALFIGTGKYLQCWHWERRVVLLYTRVVDARIWYTVGQNLLSAEHIWIGSRFKLIIKSIGSVNLDSGSRYRYRYRYRSRSRSISISRSRSRSRSISSSSSRSRSRKPPKKERKNWTFMFKRACVSLPWVQGISWSIKSLMEIH
jgi:hypothetical protein